MNYRKGLLLVGGSTAILTALFAAEHLRPFRVYQSLEPYDDIELPIDWQDKSEWIFARLMYPQHPNARFARYRRFGVLDWREGGTSWSQDYPRADRHFAQAMRRLTRLSVRSVEQPINLDDGEDVFNYPGLGSLLLRAVEGLDYPLMQALFLLITLAVLFSLLFCDVLTALLDPRTRESS